MGASVAELYLFRENNLTWTVTSADTSYVHDTLTYAPIAIGHDEIQSRTELSKANITVTTSIDNAMARRWMKSAADAIVTLTIFSKDLESGTTLVAWKGRLSTVKPTDKSIQLFFESIFTSLRRPGLRQRFQRTCPYVLYGAGCKVDKEAFAVPGTVAAVDGVGLLVDSAGLFADGYFQTGMVESPDMVYRFITRHVGTTLNLIRPISGLVVGDTIRIFPGCDRSTQICKDRFNNLLNNGAFPYIPLKNPFTGGPIA